ncbi:MAG: PQQ-binding-like beta-propeller repeat protein [Vicinamibacterales bacterium]
MAMRRLYPIVIVFLGSLAADLGAEHWPHWRGPSASGVSPESGLPVRWADSENIAWKAPLGGSGVSSPIVWGDLVFVTSQTGSGVVRPGPRLVQSGNPLEAGERPLGNGPTSGDGNITFLVSAFDRSSGRPAWKFELAAEGPFPPVHEKHNLASPSPVTDGERVYAWFASGQIAAVDLAGKLAWKKHLGAEYVPFDIDWGHGSSPVIYKDQLILLCYHDRASYLLALDSRTGAVRWKADASTGETSYSTPLVVETGGKAEIVVNSSAGVSGHDISTGERLWHIEGDNRFPVPSPLFHNGVIYTSRGYRSSPFMAIRPGGKGDVAASHVPWKAASGAPYISSLLHYDGLIYMVGDVGVLTVVDAVTGERLHQERVGGVYTASPVAGDGKIYLVSEDGETIVVAAGRIPRVLARNRLNARQLASPAIAGGRLFIRSDDAVYAIEK